MDSQSVKTVEESAGIRGYDAHKCVKGRKRHLLIDTLGLPIACYVTPADVHDTVGARKLLGGLAYFVPRFKKIWADAAYRGKELADWCHQQGDGWKLEMVEREPGTRGFAVQPRRWTVERSFAWLIRNRRLAKAYERRVQTSETLIELAMLRLLLRRLGRCACACWAERHRLASGNTPVAPSRARSSSSPRYDPTGNGGPSHSMPWARHNSGSGGAGTLAFPVSRKNASSLPAGVTAARILPGLSPTDAQTWDTRRGATNESPAVSLSRSTLPSGPTSKTNAPAST